MNEILSFFAMWLADLLVLGTVLLATACLLFVMLRHPAARMALARGTLLGLATLCMLTAFPFWPRQPLAELFSGGIAEREAVETVSPSMEGAVYPAPLVIEAPRNSGDESPSVSPTNNTFSISRLVRMLPLFWLGAAGCAVAYIFVGGWRAFRLLRSAVKAPDWSQQELDRLVSPKNRSPRLKTSERIATAVALLAWRPHILLATRSVTEINKAAVRAALAHEWAHIRHGDLWVLALERLLLPVFCLHPLFWLLRRQVRIDQELLADAAAAGDAPVEYAQALLSWAKAEHSVAAPRWGIAALSLWEHPSNLSRRVEMLLHAPSVAICGSRLGKWLTSLSVIAAVLGLSLITLRPSATAQDDALTETEVQPRPAKIKKAKKQKPKKADAIHGDVAPDRSPPQAPPTDAQVFLELLVGQVEHAALEKAESSLGDLIQAASEDHCRLEGELIVAELSPKQLSTLTVELKNAGALTILSEPSLATLDQQEATLQIGSEVPLLRLEETVNGDPKRRVEYRAVGETIVIRPFLSDKDPTRLTLDIAAEHSELDKRAELRTGDDTPRFIIHKFKLEVEAVVGKTLVIAEKGPKKGSGHSQSILLAIRPQKVLFAAPPAPTSATLSAKLRSDSRGDLAPLRDENAALRKQVEDLQVRLVDLEVQIRWLRAAAAPGGEEKVSDDVFLRRVYLDLMGLLPTADETRSFLSDKDPRKRDKLIDRLLEGSAAKKEASTAWKAWKDILSNDPNAKPAAVKPSPQAGAGEDKDPDSMQVFRLAHSQADSVAEVLAKVFPKAEGLAVGVDARTNSLIIRGSPEALQKVKALLELLDRKHDPKADVEESAPPEIGGSLRESKEAGNKLKVTISLRELELKVTISLRELELKEAETALRSAETALASSEKLSKKGFLPPGELAKAQVAVFEQMITVKNAKSQLEKAKADSASKP